MRTIFTTTILAISGLWATAQTPQLFKDIYPGTISAGTNFDTTVNLMQYNNALYFGAKSVDHSVTLWKSDGTPGGTALFKDASGLWWGPLFSSDSMRYELTIANNNLYFSALNKNGNASGLWKTDGTISGTQMIKNSPNYYFPSLLTNINDNLFFEDSAGVWKSDGTKTGTVFLLPEGDGPLCPYLFHNINGNAIFPHNGGVVSDYTLYKSDGTPSGTAELSSNCHFPAHFYDYQGNVFFSAYDNAVNSQCSLWKTDGTVNGTVKVTNKILYMRGYGSQDDNVFTTLNNTLYFGAMNPNNDYGGLWKSDGTDNGTVFVKTIGSMIAIAANTGSNIFFWANDRIHGYELWISDGSASGTHMIKDINPGIASNLDTVHIGANSYLKALNVNGIVYFAANDGIHGEELWKTDGTDAGTVMVSDINAGPSGSKPNNFVLFNNNLFFWANDSVHGRELWSMALPTTGIVNNTNKTTTHIYPNPFNDQVNITWPIPTNGKLLLYNNLGQIVWEQTISNTLNTNLNTQMLAQGLYIVVLQNNENRTVLGKIAKEK